MPKLHIRDSTVEDVEKVTAIYTHEVLNGSATFEEKPPSLSAMIERRKAILNLGLPFLVAEIDGIVVGYAYAFRYRSRDAYRKTVENSVYIEAEYRGYGIGAALLKSMIERCEAGSWTQMIAVIGDSKNQGSISLHNKLGFRKVGILRNVGFKFGQWVDTVIMQRELAARHDRVSPNELAA